MAMGWQVCTMNHMEKSFLVNIWTELDRFHLHRILVNWFRFANQLGLVKVDWQIRFIDCSKVDGINEDYLISVQKLNKRRSISYGKLHR